MAIITPHFDQEWVEGESFGEVESRQRTVYRRLKGSYGPTYLTILSVIQAVAMGDLAQVVAGSYHHFTPVQWVLTFNTFGVLIIIWNAYSVQSTLWGWIPDVRDSAVPFVVGALELYLNHTIIVSLSAWLVAVSLVGVAGAAGTAYIFWRASHEAEHLELLGWLSIHIRLYVAYLTAGGVVLVALAWLCSDDHLPALVGSAEAGGWMALGVALSSTVALGGGVYVLHLLWREAIIYAQADPDYSQRTATSGIHRLRPRRGRRTRPAQPAALSLERAANEKVSNNRA
jgi:hypothetical protein